MPIYHNLGLHNCKYYSVVFRRKCLGNHCCCYSYLETNHRCLLNPNDDTMVLHLLHSDKPKVYYTLQKSWWKCKIASLVYLAPTYIYIYTYLLLYEKYECVVRWKRCKLMIGETASKVLTASLQRRTIALSCQDGNSRCRAQINEPIAIRGPLLFVSRWAGYYIG